MQESQLKKKQLLRNIEYYDMQETYDKLYFRAKKGNAFTALMQYISDEQNILLAYRNIKKNSGSTTVGTDNRDITYYERWIKDRFVKYFQNKLLNYQLKSVRRVEIPKPNGKTRPLGIPCMEDRIIQQCIKQVLEPICETKFHNHSYGFRPNRSASHAIARCMKLINKAKLHYVVDIDIKGFFDNVNHAKLLKQLWSMGIQDKNLLSIIGKILKSEIEGEGIPTKGTPQGGIVSPLLSNVVLNELDWWISDQWETLETNHKYTRLYKYRAIKTTNLKEIWITRYADDFKIWCRDYKTACKIYQATKKWLKERLGLEISPEKSKITNVRKGKTEFLGFTLNAELKGEKYVCQSKVSDKAKQSATRKLKEQIKRIQKHYKHSQEVNKLNSMILGMHNYYKVATKVSGDFRDINSSVNRTLYNRLRSHITDKPHLSETYKRLYGQYRGKIKTIAGIAIFPTRGVTNKPPMCFSQDICNYTKEGRELIHKKLNGGFTHLIKYLLDSSHEPMSTEYCDNRISLIAGQRGICYITGEQLAIGCMDCHHKTPKHMEGSDEYKNLVWMHSDAHKLIHASEEKTIDKYLRRLNLDEKGLKRVNSLRKRVGNLVI